AFDSGAEGINQWIAGQLGLSNVTPLRVFENKSSDSPTIGSGRFGDLAQSMDWTEFHTHLETQLSIERYQWVPSDHKSIRRVGIACGAAAEFLKDAHRERCDVFVTGEARFHACLEARSLGIGMILLGHYGSERPAVEMLANRLAHEFPQLNVWASQEETDPISWKF
ncbi:MAG: Nif3-like dinuclear metal center hexameric protein, partial [Planctomycetaceae bacterium]|nr:Nif3-like dinuclear metal center hexameric protein [Planctomycetaceae bacterium]